MAPTNHTGAPRGRANAEDPEILVRLVTQDVAALKHFLATNPVEVVRVLLPDAGYPAWATVLTRESVAASARRMAEFEVVVLARPPTTDRMTNEKRPDSTISTALPIGSRYREPSALVPPMNWIDPVGPPRVMHSTWKDTVSKGGSSISATRR